MSKNDVSFTEAEARALVRCATSIRSEMASNIFHNSGDREKYDAVELRLFRRYCRLLAFPEVVLAELPPFECGELPFTTKDRELLYWLLGNYSPRVMSLSDQELMEETFRMLRDYR